jgi:hypothetical protein
LLVAAAVIQGAVGFGFALVAAPILLLIHPPLIPGPLMVAGTGLAIGVLIREWRHIHRPGLVPLFLGFFPGLAVGGGLILLLSPRQTALLFGLLTLFSVGLSLIKRTHFQPHATLLFAAGFFSAIMNTTTTMGGPPVALIYQHMPGPQLRGTLAFFFSTGALCILGTLWQFDHLSRTDITLGGWMAIPVGVGLWLSGPASRWLDHGHTRQAALLVSGGAGIMVLWRALLGG